MFAKRLRAAAWTSALLLVSTALGFILTRPPSPLAAADRLVQAVAFQLLSPHSSVIPDVVVVGITEDTLAGFPYRSPIDRAFLASVIDALARAGARAVGLDVVLDRATEPAKDAALRRSLMRTDIPVVVISIAPETVLPDHRRQFLDGFLGGVRTGDANLARDLFDDTVRDHVPFHPVTGRPSFPAAIAMALGVSVPRERFPVAWHRRGGASVVVYPAEAIALLPPGWLKGKIALIGSLIAGSDEHRTMASAFGPPSFGVVIHAEVVAQLLRGEAVPRPAVPWVELLAIGCLAAVAIALGWFWSGSAAILTLGVAGIGYVACVCLVYAYTGYLAPMVGPVFALAVAGAGARIWRGRGERRDRRALRALFSRFVSEPVVEQIMRDRDLFMAGGRPKPQQLTATVLFADVAGFTTICEALAPEPLIAWLDQYIDTMAGLIMAHHGVLLRFIGDGILAVFGAPVPRQDTAGIASDAHNAACCALAMEKAMQSLNEAWAAAGLPVGGLRVGLHTGPMVAGSLGTGARMEFCLLGDTANIGARLEQLGKDHADGTPTYCTIVVGEPTWELLAGALPGIAIGRVMLRGRHVAMGAYRIDAGAARLAVRAQPPTGSPVSPDPVSL